MRGIRWGWRGALIVACGIGASAASADLQPAEPPVSLQVGGAVSRSAEALPTDVSIISRRDALRACIKQKEDCIAIAGRDALDEDVYGLTPKMIQACAEKTGGKVIESFGEGARKSQIAEVDLRELLRKCRPGVV